MYHQDTSAMHSLFCQDELLLFC